MMDSKKKVIMMGVFSCLLFVTVIAITALAFKKQEKVETGIKKKVVVKAKQRRKKSVANRVKPVAPRLNEALTDEEKKKKEEDEFREAREELRASFQGSKMQKLMQKRMAERKKKYYADLFEKYGIDEEGQDAIIKSLTDGQMEIRDLMRSSEYHSDKSEENRLAIGERLALIQEETDNKIKEVAGDEFLNDSLEKKSTTIRENYIKRIDKSLKMSNEQKNELDALYSSTQTSFVERFTLPKDELDARTATFQDGLRDILTEDQYSKYQKTQSSKYKRRRK